MGKGLRPREYSSRNRDCLSLIFITAASNSYLPFSVRWPLMQADNTALPSAPIRPPHDSPTSPKNLAGNTLVLFSSSTPDKAESSGKVGGRVPHGDRRVLSYMAFRRMPYVPRQVYSSALFVYLSVFRFVCFSARAGRWRVGLVFGGPGAVQLVGRGG